jgi:hypothetical protein
MSKYNDRAARRGRPGSKVRSALPNLKAPGGTTGAGPGARPGGARRPKKEAGRCSNGRPSA